MNLFQNLKRNQTGSAVTGFSFVAPLIILLTFVVLQFIFVVVIYGAISFVTENAARLTRIGYSDLEIIKFSQTKINESNFIPQNSKIFITNKIFNGKNLKIIKVETNLEILGVAPIKVSSQSYAF